MKYSPYIIIGLTAVALLYFGIFSREQPQPNNNPETNTKQNWESKTNDQSAVAITVTPIDILPQSKEWKFDVVMDTHSVELNQDLTKVIALVDDSGKEYKPLRWKGVPAGGHHREGTLIFNQITPAPKSIELKISGIGEVVRSFIWQLK